MLDRSIFTSKYLNELILKYKASPQILERTIFAFGLLESLTLVKLDFIFKGGTSLMLLSKKPFRLSTDIDIIVPPNTNLDDFIKKASVIYPFIRFEESIRKINNLIIKKHYKFYYQSIIDSKKETFIFLDVLFEECEYSQILKKEIKNELLMTTEPKTFVKIPSVESIIGDKLTAFAPHTIGIIPIQKREDIIIDKRVEVIKQFIDIANLFDLNLDFEIIKNSYINISKREIYYRGLNLSYKECLLDTFNSALSILTRGYFFPEDYEKYLFGIQKIRTYIINNKYTGELAINDAAKIMYLSICLLTNTKFEKIIPIKELLKNEYSRVNKIKKTNIDSFNMAAHAIELYLDYLNKEKEA